MFRFTINAGHGKYTAGKSCDKTLDPKGTPEWELNARVCEKIEKKLKEYSGYEYIRLDDRTGETDIPLPTRIGRANDFKADFYLSIHHNAGAARTTSGGIYAITYLNVDDVTRDWQKALYDSLIKHTGLKGNRASPLARMNLKECRETKMPAVLLELGFMDSKTDVPIILTDDFAEKCATAIVEVLVAKGGLTKKQTTPTGGKIYRVQVGAFSVKANAEAMLKKLKQEGYNPFIVEVEKQ